MLSQHRTFATIEAGEVLSPTRPFERVNVDVVISQELKITDADYASWTYARGVCHPYGCSSEEQLRRSGTTGKGERASDSKNDKVGGRNMIALKLVTNKEERRRAMGCCRSLPSDKEGGGTAFSKGST